MKAILISLCLTAASVGAIADTIKFGGYEIEVPDQVIELKDYADSKLKEALDKVREGDYDDFDHYVELLKEADAKYRPMLTDALGRFLPDDPDLFGKILDRYPELKTWVKPIVTPPTEGKTKDQICAQLRDQAKFDAKTNNEKYIQHQMDNVSGQFQCL